jgi:hypothetical protein
MVVFWPLMFCSPKVFWQKWSLFFEHGSLAFWFLMCSGPKVFWQMGSRFFGHGSFLAFDVFWSKGLLADVVPVFWAWQPSGL